MEKKKKAIQLNTQDIPAVSRRSFMTKTTLLGAGLAFGTRSWAASSDLPEGINTISDKGLPGSDEFINTLADLMAHSTRTPILRWPNEYGMEYEDIFFPALDGG